MKHPSWIQRQRDDELEDAYVSNLAAASNGASPAKKPNWPGGVWCGFLSLMSISQVKCPPDVHLDMKVRFQPGGA